MTKNLIGLAWHVVWCIQDLRHVVECVGHGRNTNKENDKDCVKEGL